MLYLEFSFAANGLCIWGTWLKSHPNYRYRWIIRCSKLRQSVCVCVGVCVCWCVQTWIKTPLGLYCVDHITLYHHNSIRVQGLVQLVARIWHTTMKMKRFLRQHLRRCFEICWDLKSSHVDTPDWGWMPKLGGDWSTIVHDRGKKVKSTCGPIQTT